MGKIAFDEKRANDEIHELRTIGRQLKKVKEDQFKEQLASLQNHWKGEAADAYIKKANVLVKKMESTVDLIEDLANAMDTVATRLKKSENANLATLTNKISGL